MKFKVGDVVIVKECAPRVLARRNIPVGVECTIIRVEPNESYGLFYETDIPSSNLFYRHYWGCDGCFELKSPPQREAVGEWALCPWKPERIRVSEDGL